MIKQKNYSIQGQNKLPWTVDEVLTELKNMKKSKGCKGKDIVEVYPRINEYDNLMWHLEVYEYKPIK